MREFRKLFDLPAAKLSKADVEDLARIVTDGLSADHANQRLSFCLTKGDENYRAGSVEELFSQVLPNAVDSLDFSAAGGGFENPLHQGVRIALHRTFAHCQVWADNEIWFNGKIEQITRFFKVRRPWYGKFPKIFSGLFGAIQGLSGAAFVLLLMRSYYIWTICPVVTFALCQIAFDKYTNGKLFPYIDIELAEVRPPIIGNRLLVVCTVVGVILQAVAIIVAIIGIWKL